MSDCKHLNFGVDAKVNRLEETPDGAVKQFMLELTVRCEDCALPFRFIGLPGGLDLNGAAASVDGEEGRFAIAPRGEVFMPMEGLQGFSVRKSNLGDPGHPGAQSGAGGKGAAG